jgi:hypothetical protein
MVDLGTLVASIMNGLIQARRMADEQTAALAEYYKEHPLLEVLSVPRIRISEISIDMPLMVNHITIEVKNILGGETLKMAIQKPIEEILTKYESKSRLKLSSLYLEELNKELTLIQEKKAPITEELISRGASKAFDNAITQSGIAIDEKQKKAVLSSVISQVQQAHLGGRTIAPTLQATAETDAIKENSSNTTVMRLKATFKEEGLEWGSKSGPNGEIERFLQPE